MHCLLALQLWFGLGLVAAQDQSPMSLCTDESCGNCPNALTTDGTGYPECVIYERDTVLGGKEDEYPPVKGNSRTIYYDIASTGADRTCRVIIRSPANTDEVNCGVPIYAGRGDTCFEGETKSTFMVQYCCGDSCNQAGVKRNGLGGFAMPSMVLRDSAGNIVVPHQVGTAGEDRSDVFLEDHGLNSSSVIKTRSASGTPVYKIGYAPENTVKKRGCDQFTEGGRYTSTGTQSYVMTPSICGTDSELTYTNEQSVSRTTTFGASVGDPFGIVSASTEFSFEETASQSTTFTFKPKQGQCGHISWTPFFDCIKGTITGDCEGGDQSGETCTAKRIGNGDIDGSYNFVVTD